jgi:hypothetical protein
MAQHHNIDWNNTKRYKPLYKDAHYNDTQHNKTKYNNYQNNNA